MQDRIAPSLSGVAFSICAAALPLLKVRSVSLCAAVKAAVETTLPYIFEPGLCPTGSRYALGQIDVDRLQHLVRRLYQIVVYLKYDSSDHFRNDDDLTAWSCDLLIGSIASCVLDLVPKDGSDVIEIGEKLRLFMISLCSSSKLAGMGCQFVIKAKELLSTVCPEQVIFF